MTPGIVAIATMSFAPALAGESRRPPAELTAERLGIKYNPNSVVAAESQPVGGRISDAILLPRYTTTGARLKLTAKEVMTDEARLAQAKDKYLHPVYRTVLGPLSQVAGYYFNFLSIFGGWRPNDLEAIALYRQDERLQMLSDMKDLIRLENLNAPRPSKELNRIHFGATLESR